MARNHTHVYRWDTRDWAQQPGGAGYVCTDCGFRIPENARPAAEKAGALFIPHSAAQEALRAHIDTDPDDIENPEMRR